MIKFPLFLTYFLLVNSPATEPKYLEMVNLGFNECQGGPLIEIDGCFVAPDETQDLLLLYDTPPEDQESI